MANLENEIRCLAKQVSPNYPGINDNDISVNECLWAIQTSFRGLEMANADLQKAWRIMIEHSGMSIEDAITLVESK